MTAQYSARRPPQLVLDGTAPGAGENVFGTGGGNDTGNVYGTRDDGWFGGSPGGGD